ncbi:choice-of-anchor tandem repeat GloVer-containing protein [Terriglobus roseus]|uniref:choice-of-anchor tandem repeat GloVer-containing protein n=1 Tax=Terriglobus roseus TaxID=392734 RepID=UPI0011147B35|nr:choice-of-anchor tandem repeat GloVer-containing protein [Terriglobus roseus]
MLPLLFASAQGLLYTLSLCGLPTAAAQTTTAYSTPVALSTPVQAADGNFYTATSPTSSCNGSVFFHTTGNCGAIYQITPTGVVSLVHTFASDGTEGFDPNPLVIGPDGNIYGMTQGGGTSGCSTRGCGTFFKIVANGSSGTFSTVHFFSDADTGAESLAQPILGDDGYFYEPTFGITNGSAIYNISPTGDFHLLTLLTAGYPTNRLVQGADHNFYGSLYSGTVEGGYIFQMTPSGVTSTVYALPADNSAGIDPTGLAQGPDGYLYGWTLGSPNHYPYAPATAFKVSTSGSFQTLYTSSATNTFVMNSPPIFGSDGNLYASAVLGGDLSACAAYFGSNHNGCGAILQVTPSGTFKVVQQFVEGDKGQFPQQPTQGSDGKIVAAASHYEKNANTTATVPGVLSMLDLNLPAPVQLSFADGNGNPITGSIQPGVPLTLKYKVPGAYSLTASQCYAFVQPDAQGDVPAAAGTWTGKQSGTTDATGFYGSAQVTPTADGTYTYALTCGGTTSGFVTLNLSSKLQITTSSLPNGSVSKAYTNPILIDGGKSPYKFVADGLPPGITIDPTSGLLAGKPTQFGTYQTTIAVQDSSTPALTAGRVLPLTIDKSLMLSGSLKNATVGTQYTGGLTATGGFGTYKWTISAGALPEGLTLNATTGVISGKPTKGEKATFSITITDGENPVDTVTLATSISTVAPPLMVIGGDFVDCTVGVLCDNQFEASGGTPPYTWTVAPGATLPAGMTLASDGSFSFKPIQYYDLPFQIEVQVTDSSKPALTATGIDALTITSSLKANPYTLPVATVGQAYAAPAPVATGGLPPYTWLVIGSDPSVKGEYGAKADGSLYSPGPKTAGTYTITYILKDSEKNQATVQFSVPFTVMAALTPTTTTLSSSNTTAGTGMNVTLTASVARSAGVPTGKVTFYNGTAVLGVSTLDATGSASLTTSFGAAGSYSLTAQYSGDAGFAGSVSPALTETVVTPAVTATANPATLTVTSGKSGTLTLSLSGTGGYSGIVTFTCGTLPSHVSCSFAPPSLTLSSSVTSGSSTLTVSTGPTATALMRRTGLPSRRAPLELAGLLGLTLLWTSRRTRLRLLQLSPMALLLIAFATMTALGLSGCGTASPNASPGTYAVPVNVVVGGATVQSVTVSVVVMQQ